MWIRARVPDRRSIGRNESCEDWEILTNENAARSWGIQTTTRIRVPQSTLSLLCQIYLKLFIPQSRPTNSLGELSLQSSKDPFILYREIYARTLRAYITLEDDSEAIQLSRIYNFRQANLRSYKFSFQKYIVNVDNQIISHLRFQCQNQDIALTIEEYI